MKTIKLYKEKVKLIFLILSTVIFFSLGYIVLNGENYSSALLGVSAASLGLSLFQLKRIFTFTKRPETYTNEQIELKDERNIMLVEKSKSCAYDIETFVILGITAYAIYSDNVGFVLAVLVLWSIRIFSFFYYFSKKNNEY